MRDRLKAMYKNYVLLISSDAQITPKELSCFEKQMNDLLEMIRSDRKWNEEAARKQLVKFFEAFGPTDPLTVQGRKRLSSILFS